MTVVQICLFILAWASFGCQSGAVKTNPYQNVSPLEAAQFKKIKMPLNESTPFRISQGAVGCCTHNLSGYEYAWDFDVPYGTPVLAAEGGSVIQVWEPNRGGGCDAKFSDLAHNIKILHDDGTVAQYVHIQSKVKLREKVSQGQEIGKTANNGFHCAPQLHFNVFQDKGHIPEAGSPKTIPVLFEGLPDGGIAREGYDGVVPTSPTREVVTFKSGNLELKAVLFRPRGDGPFPALLYNHGSAPGMLNSQAAEILGPLYVKYGWVFFMPYRRGQGLSESAGPYIMDEVNAAEKHGGVQAASQKLNELLKGDHLADQLSGLAWLKQQSYVEASQIAVAGNSFGGIETVLGAERGSYCAAINASGAAQSWSNAPMIQAEMIRAVRNSKAPIFFFQAENDFDLSPSKVLSEVMKIAGKAHELKFYPPFGKSAKEGHSFAYMGSRIWSDDVIQFLNRNCIKPRKQSKVTK